MVNQTGLKTYEVNEVDHDSGIFNLLIPKARQPPFEDPGLLADTKFGCDDVQYFVCTSHCPVLIGGPTSGRCRGITVQL